MFESEKGSVTKPKPSLQGQNLEILVMSHTSLNQPSSHDNTAYLVSRNTQNTQEQWSLCAGKTRNEPWNWNKAVLCMWADYPP